MTAPFRRLLRPKSLAGKAGVVGVFFGAVLVVAWLSALHYSSRRLEEAWKLSDELGLPNDLESLLGPPIPDERNMAVPLDEAAHMAEAFSRNERYTRGINADHTRLDNQAYFAAYERLRMDAHYERALNDALHRPAYRSLVQAESPGVFDLSSLHTRRQLAWAEQAIARHLASRGEHAEAVRRILRLLRLTRRWEDREPFLTGALINIAMRGPLVYELNYYILRSGVRLPQELHDEIEREFRQCDAILRVLPAALQTEKFSLMATYAEQSPLGATAVLRPLAENDRAFMLRFLHEVACGVDLPFNDAKARIDANDRRMAQMKSDPLGRVLHAGAIKMLPGLVSARHAFEGAIARSRCLRVINAWSRHGDFNIDLEKLGLPAECLVDPFDGQRMRVKRTPYGPIVYSVYFDLKDGGGCFNGSAGKLDIGLGPLELDSNFLSRVQQ